MAFKTCIDDLCPVASKVYSIPVGTRDRDAQCYKEYLSFHFALPCLTILVRSLVVGHYEAYDEGVLHGDIDPENLLILLNGHGVLIDFDNAIVRSIHRTVPEDPFIVCIFRCHHTDGHSRIMH